MDVPWCMAVPDFFNDQVYYTTLSFLYFFGAVFLLSLLKNRIFFELPGLISCSGEANILGAAGLWSGAGPTLWEDELPKKQQAVWG